jgi:hypothetical protein
MRDTPELADRVKPTIIASSKTKSKAFTTEVTEKSFLLLTAP